MCHIIIEFESNRNCHLIALLRIFFVNACVLYLLSGDIYHNKRNVSIRIR